MAGKKRKTRHDNREGRVKRNPSNNRTLAKTKNGEGRKRTGPRLPNALLKEIELVDGTKPSNANTDEEVIESDDANDLYEYDEAVPEEESRKNRRFDSVDNFEYQLPEQFEDEDVASEEDEDEDEDEIKREDEGRHARMLKEVTGIPVEVFEGKKRKNVVISEAYPESEYNPTRDVLDGGGHISVNDLLDPLHGKSGFSKLRKSIDRMEKKSMPIQASLPKADRDMVERKVAYEQSKKAFNAWVPLVKRNREAPNLYFDKDINLGFNTIGAMAAAYEPRTEFEKKIAAIVNDKDIVEAHRNDGARLLELNKISVEDVKDQRNRLAKMRNLLFCHELKAKRIKKIKSKTYHRMLKKDRLKAATAEMGMNPEAAKELAMKQEFKRAEERLTLKHKNSSKWAKRILKRGLNAQDEGTRAAISEQLHQHALLTRKMNSMKDGSSSDDSSDTDEDDDNSDNSDHNRALKLLEKAKEKTLGVIEEDNEVPKSGVLSLPFMVRGLQKQKEATKEEAKLAINEYESSLKHLDYKTVGENVKSKTVSGRRVFGAPKKQVAESSKSTKVDNYYGSSDSEGDLEVKDRVAVGHGESKFQRDLNINPDLLREESEISHDTLFKSFEEIAKDPGPKTTYEVAIFASDSWKKAKNFSGKENDQVKSDKEVDATKSSRTVELALHDQDSEDVGDGSESDNEGQMIDGFLSSGTKSRYELPSQADLIRRAFAGDDVEDEFEKVKQELLNEENPEPEKPILLPGWGDWTHIQRKKGLPLRMLEEHEKATKVREEALKKRKDAHLKHVIISEKIDKKSEKFFLKKVPYPYPSKEVYEQSIRMPLGPECNPVSVVGALNRPQAVRRPGVIIEPRKLDRNPC